MPAQYLLAISIGPVQDFIAASRKTRDLWFGSMLLGQAARAAAKVLAQPGATLIFPALSSDNSEKDETPVPNKLLAIVSSDDPAAIAKAVKEAAAKVMTDYVTKVKSSLPAGDVDWTLVDNQVEHFLEYYAAWVPYDPDNYVGGRERVERLLAGRKALRDFHRSFGKSGVAKSSLDPSRETVLMFDGQLMSNSRRYDDRDKLLKFRRRLNLRGAEQLDGISLLKRHGSKERFPSVSRVAIDPFIRRLDEKTCKELEAIALQIGDSDAVEQFHTNPGSGLKHYAAFPYDTQLFWGDGTDGEELEDPQKEVATTFHKKVEAARKKLDFGELPIYFAVLAADGDRMGKAINDRKSPKVHKEFSERLAKFAGQASVIVRAHHGALVYSGGDDVLAFLPLDTALCCADTLRLAFAAIVNEAGDKHPVTLSVGIAIGHYSEHLQNLLAWARDAEHAAKEPKDKGGGGRNALAVALHTRTAGAAGVTVVHSWTDEPVQKRWLQWVEWHRADRFPDGAAYELRELEKELRGVADAERKKLPPDRPEDEDWQSSVETPRYRRDGKLAQGGDEKRSLLELEILRILERKEPRGGPKLTDRELLPILGFVDNNLDGLKTLTDELIIARRLAHVSDVAHGPYQEGQDICEPYLPKTEETAHA